MKHRSHLRGKRPAGGHAVAPPATTVMDHDNHMPPPDPSTRVDVDFGSKKSPNDVKGGGELIVAAGLGGILVAVGSAFVKLLDLPSLSEVSVAGFGVVLVLVGALKRRRAQTNVVAVPGDVAEMKPNAVDLPTLTGQLGGVLAELRQLHGVAYRTRTWIDEVLPAYGPALTDPALVRDLLAAAALDAGGIRADVAGLVESHSRDDIVAAGSALLEALQNTLAACKGSDQPSPRPSDPSCWPASKI